MIGQTNPGATHKVGHKHAPPPPAVTARAQIPLVGLKLVHSKRSVAQGSRAVERHNYHHP